MHISISTTLVCLLAGSVTAAPLSSSSASKRGLLEDAIHLLTGYVVAPFVTEIKANVTSVDGASRYQVTRVNATLGRGLAWAGAPSYIPKIATGNLISWYHHWEGDVLPSMPSDVEFVPQFWGIKKLAQWKSVESNFNQTNLPKYLIGQNEPEIATQAGETPYDAAGNWIKYLAPYQKRGVKVGSPAIVWDTNWLSTFLSTLQSQGHQPDFLTAHWYGGPKDLPKFKNWVETLRAKFNQTIWITEFGTTTASNGTAQEVATFNQAATMWMQNQTYVERAAWFGCFDNNHAPDAFGAKLNAFFNSTGDLNEMALTYMFNNKTLANGTYSASNGLTDLSDVGSNAANQGGDYNQQSSNQGVSNTGYGGTVDPSAWSSSTAATGNYIYKDVVQGVSSMSSLLSRAPQPLQAIGTTIQQAAAANGLQPQLLYGMAVMESSGCTNNENAGCFQFTDDGAWKQYGGGANKNNNVASAWAAARYMHDLVQQNGGSLYNALRAYNGAVGHGGNPTYQTQILGFMRGQNL